jgi:hypothetical protein
MLIWRVSCMSNFVIWKIYEKLMWMEAEDDQIWFVAYDYKDVW